MLRGARLGLAALFLALLPLRAAPPVPAGDVAPQHNQIGLLLHGSLESIKVGALDDALDKANAVLVLDPKNIDAHSLRGALFSQIKLWDEAQKEYEAILVLDPRNTVAKFNLAEIKFRLKYYDDAKAGFLEIQKDPEWGDLSFFKSFLCDLYNGHEQMAEVDLKIFDLAGSNASYYFGHVAWALYHHDHEEGRKWLKSAARIFTPRKVALYAASLEQLGYLPIPPPANGDPEPAAPPAEPLSDTALPTDNLKEQ